MVRDNTTLTEATFAHHMQALGAGQLDDLLSDYTEDSVLFSAFGRAHGTAEIRAFFETTFKTMPGMTATFEILKQEIEGEIVYFIWKAPPYVTMGSDTFVMRDGKIMVQTVTAFMPS